MGNETPTNFLCRFEGCNHKGPAQCACDCHDPLACAKLDAAEARDYALSLMKRIEELTRQLAAERERVIEECAKVARQYVIEVWLSIQSGDQVYKEIRRLAEKPEVKP